MPKLHETQMGQRLFTSLLPRLVTAVEEIAKSLKDTNRIEVLELALNLPDRGRIECNDGFSFILGRYEGRGLKYCVTFCTHEEPLLADYTKGYEVDSVWNGGYLQTKDIPAEVIAQIIINHGGIVDV